MPADEAQRPHDAPEVVAHRGASGYERELSLQAYDLALAQGADVLELDLRATADSDLVLVHDATLLRTADDPRRVDELTRAAIDALDDHAVPLTFDAFLQRYGCTTNYLVDLKEPSPAWEHRVIATLEEHGVRDRTVVQSFDLDALARLHRAAPALALSALYRRADSVGLAVDDVPPFVGGVGVWHQAVDAGFVASAHARGLKVQPWTVNEPQEATRLLELGVDAVVTDTPDVIVAARDARMA